MKKHFEESVDRVADLTLESDSVSAVFDDFFVKNRLDFVCVQSEDVDSDDCPQILKDNVGRFFIGFSGYRLTDDFYDNIQDAYQDLYARPVIFIVSLMTCIYDICRNHDEYLSSNTSQIV